MATKPRPLGNKAREQVERTERELRTATNLMTDAMRNLDRDPDLARAQIRDARYHNRTAEAMLTRLRAGDFSED